MQNLSPTPRKPERVVLILAGGFGLRLWPLSTIQRPKPFLCLTHPTDTLLQITWQNARLLADATRIFVTAPRRWTALVRSQLPALPTANLLSEPEPRGTGPAILWSCARIHQRYPNAVMVQMASDHYIPHPASWAQCMGVAVEEAKKGPFLVSVGIVPDRPHTAYGYMQCGEQTSHESGLVFA